MNLIALTGLPRSGKDTFADCLVRAHGFERRQFSAPLKAAAAILLDRPVAQMRGEDGFDREAVLPEWGFSTRWFLQVLGTECLRDQVRADFWVERMRVSLSNVERAVITDCRFKNEADMVRNLGGIVVEIRRPGIVSTGHVSDAGVSADRYVYNDSTLDHLHKEANYLAEVTRQSARG